VFWITKRHYTSCTLNCSLLFISKYKCMILNFKVFSFPMDDQSFIKKHDFAFNIKLGNYFSSHSPVYSYTLPYRIKEKVRILLPIKSKYRVFVFHSKIKQALIDGIIISKLYRITELTNKS